MGQVITEPRRGDTPGPGTRGAQRREDSQSGGLRRAVSGWRLLAVVVGIGLAVAIGWLLGARDTDAGTVTTASEESAALTDEKGTILAGRGAAAVTSAQEAVTNQQEKAQLVADGAAVASTDADDGGLHDEKVELTARWTGAATPEVPESLTEQAEKELLLAG